jgi:hypothetical protein
MIKKILLLTLVASFLLIFTLPAQANLGFLKLFIAHKNENCPKSRPTTDNEFCPSFEKAASCHCSSSGLPKTMCQDMEKVYQRMLMVFSTQQLACEYQQNTPTQRCIDNWNCYRKGGKDSAGHPCGATGKSCPT